MCPQNETDHGLKLLFNQRTQWCGYIEKVINITNVNPNSNSRFSVYLNKSRFQFQICDTSLPQDQTGSFFCHKMIPLMSTLDQRCVSDNYYKKI